MTPLSGGHWVTINGHHVYLKGTGLQTEHVEAAADLGGLPDHIKKSLVEAHKNGQLSTAQQVHNVVADVAGAMSVMMDEDHAFQTALKTHGGSANATGVAGGKGAATTQIFLPHPKGKGGAHVPVATHGSAIQPGEVNAYASKFNLQPGALPFLHEAVLNGALKDDTHLAKIVADTIHVHKMTGHSHSEAVKNLLAGKSATQTIADMKKAAIPQIVPPTTQATAQVTAQSAQVAPPTSPSATITVDPSTPPLQSVGQLHHGHFLTIPDVNVGEGPLPPLKPGQTQSAGILIVEPDGKIWIYEPKNHFAGYEHTFSKGGVEPGLSLQQSAHKELYEELGLTANITGVLGDFSTSGTNTRYYIGVRTGGDPKDAEKGLTQKLQETDNVKLVAPSEAATLLNRKRDQDVLNALNAHLATHGNPHSPVSTETTANASPNASSVVAPPSPAAPVAPPPVVPAPAPVPSSAAPTGIGLPHLQKFANSEAKAAGLKVYASAPQALLQHLTQGDISEADVPHIVAEAIKLTQKYQQKVLTKAAVTSAVFQHIQTQGGNPTAASKPSPAPAPTPNLAPGVQHHVTIQKKKFNVDHSIPATVNHVDDLKNEIKVSSNGETALKGAVNSGSLSTHGQLIEKAAMMQASSEAQGYTSVNNHGFTGTAAYPSIEALLDAAHNGDSDAKKIEAKLGPHSFQSQAAQKAAATAAQKAQADASFRKATPSDHEFKKVGGKGGYNNGALYELPDGTRNYVKTPPSPPKGYEPGAAAHNEHLANAIYQALGHSAPNSKVFTDGSGQVKYASQIIDNKGDLAKHGISADVARDLLKGFAADVLLGNHDVLGNGNNQLSNVVVGHDGKAHRIDNGGSLLFTGVGAKKTSTARSQISEWDGFADPGTNHNYAKVFQAAGVRSAEGVPHLAQQIKAISALRDQHGGWDAFIAKSAPEMSLAQRHETAQLLEDRTKLLEDKVSTLPGGNSLVGARTFAFNSDPKQIREELKQLHMASGLKMTPDQQAAMKSHQGFGYGQAAAILLKGHTPDPKIVGQIQALDTYFAQPGATIGKDVALSRNIPMHAAELDKLRVLPVGTIIGNTPVHQSTSTNPQVKVSGDDLQLCILAPKETPGVSMGAYADDIGEAEVLLPRGLSYRVVAVMNPGDADAPEVPSGWTWRKNAKENGVRLVVEPIIAGVNDAENTEVPVHHINEDAIVKAHQKLAAQNPTTPSPATPNLSGIHVSAPWNPGAVP